MKLQNPDTRDYAAYIASRIEPGNGTIHIGTVGDVYAMCVMGEGQYDKAHHASRISVETGIWAFKKIRQTKRFWQVKEWLMKRIFRVLNIRLWQERRYSAYTDGIFASCVAVIVGYKNIWVGKAGGDGVVLFTPKNSEPRELVFSHTAECLGADRYGFVPAYLSLQHAVGDTVTVMSRDTYVLSGQEKVRTVLTKLASGMMSVDDACDVIMEKSVRTKKTRAILIVQRI